MITKGQKINERYQIVKTIGEGGMANVYLAWDVILERNVAVKVLRGDLSTDEKFVRRFQREALSASSLSHPNVVEVYDVGEDQDLFYIVMEYIDGKHLKQLLKKRGTLTLQEVIDIMLQVTDGLAAAHDSYIIHRDIKPQNIMILENGLLKITDFGIAMALNGTQLTQTNSVMGSVHYLPPEQASGKGSTIQSDVYSLGILMYELLSGTLPYRGDNPVEIALKHLKDPLPSIKKSIPDLPQAIENIVLRSAAKNPKNRYADAREMHDDLMTCLDESRANEEPYVYPYPDSDSDAVKKEKNVKEEVSDVKPKKAEKGGEEVIAKKITEKDLKKKENKTLLILGAIFTALILITTAVVLIVLNSSGPREVEVPDVSGMSLADAESLLRDRGFTIAEEPREETSDDIEEGLVIRTAPAAGNIRVRGTSVRIFISLGEGTFEMEDFIGRNSIEIRTILEREQRLFVIVRTQQVDDLSRFRENEIIQTTPAAGERINEGGTVVLYVPDFTAVLPDFTTGEFRLRDINNFAERHGMRVEEVYQINPGVVAGTIFNQEPRAGAQVVPGGTIRVFIAEEEATTE